MRPQLPLRLDDFNEPEPDVALVKPRADFYSAGHPTASDAILVIEVADSSAQSDRRLKVPLYARFGIAEVWLVDLQQACIEIRFRPLNGHYEELRTYHRGQPIVSTALSGLALDVVAILG